MTKIVSTATVEENDGLVVLLHLGTDDAWETLRTNFADEVNPGDMNGIIASLDTQGIHFDVYEHDIDLSDVRAEVPDAEQVYRDVYNTLDSHAYGNAAGIEHCVCGDWTSAEDHNYGDHLTRAVLTALNLPIKENA